MELRHAHLTTEDAPLATAEKVPPDFVIG